MSSPPFIRFDGWTFRPDLGELTKEEQTLRLQDQPARLLQELLLHAGEVVTRDQLIARLWPKGVVDFDTGLNSAVRKVRVALQDTSNPPRYIETLPRKGYRFIGKLEPALQTPPPDPAHEAIEPPIADLPASVQARSDSPARWRIWLPLTAAAIVAAGLIAFSLMHGTTPVTQRAVVSSAPAPATAAASRALILVPFTTSANGDEDEQLAHTVTRFVYEKLAVMGNLTVIDGSPVEGVGQAPGLSHSVKASWIVSGVVDHHDDQLNAQIEVRDATSARTMASQSFRESDLQLPALRRQVIDMIARLTGATVRGVEGATPLTPAQLNAYRLYAHGEELLSTFRVADAEQALELFKRSTTLDPMLARGYLGIAQASQLTSQLRDPEATSANQAIEWNLERALALDPQLGEALVVRGRMTDDDRTAEDLFRKALRISPNYGTGYRELAERLWKLQRRGEAIDAIERACDLDPRSARNHYLRGFYGMATTGNLPAFEQAMRTALAINPDFQPALVRLGMGTWLFAGKFADAILLLEHSIAVDPESDWTRNYAAQAYLEIGDPEAARDVLREAKAQFSQLNIAQYEDQTARAGELARALLDTSWEDGANSVIAEAIRDDALATGRLGDAASRLEGKFSMGRSGVGMDIQARGFGMVYAHTLALTGQTERSHRLVSALLRQMDAEAVGRPPRFFSRERAAAFAILGDRERALNEMENSLDQGYFDHFWYISRHDPLYASFHDMPRFQALAERARIHRKEQRAKVEEMRRLNQIPRRSSAAG